MNPNKIKILLGIISFSLFNCIFTRSYFQITDDYSLKQNVLRQTEVYEEISFTSTQISKLIKLQFSGFSDAGKQLLYTYTKIKAIYIQLLCVWKV